jgi:uncharacterized protein YybS (DUF2232 family)
MKPTLVARRSTISIAVAVALILMVPLAAMQFSESVVWSLSDFATAGVLLLGTGLAADLIFRKVTRMYRLAALLALALVFFLTWVELAVGVFGSPVAGT